MTSNSNNNNIVTDEWVQWIEDGIDKSYINCYDYNEFQNINSIGAGGFGKVYRATWESSETVVALKSLKDNSFIKEIVNEVFNKLFILFQLFKVQTILIVKNYFFF